MPLKPEVETFLVGVRSFPADAMVDDEVAERVIAASRQSLAPRLRRHVDLVTDLHVEDGPRVRIYRQEAETPKPVVLFFHGGGWVSGDLEMHDATCRWIVGSGELNVISVDYRLAPEHPFPAAIEDAIAALAWTHAHCAEYGGDPTRIVVMGTSAGANLAASLSIHARGVKRPEIAAQVLVYPVIDSRMATESYRQFRTGYFLEQDQMKFYWEKYAPNEEDRRTPLASPAHENELRGLPPTLLITAEYDPLRDEGAEFASRLRKAGVIVVERQYEGQIHGFLTHLDEWADANAAMEFIVEKLADLLKENQQSPS